MSGTVTLTGEVIRKRFGRGSKSERTAVCLRTESGDYLLRRKGGLAFADPELERLVGKRLCATGVLAAYTFLITDWREIGSQNQNSS